MTDNKTHITYKRVPSAIPGACVHVFGTETGGTVLHSVDVSAAGSLFKAALIKYRRHTINGHSFLAKQARELLTVLAPTEITL